MHTPQKLVRAIATNKAAMRWPTPSSTGILDWAYHFNQTLPGTAVASLSLQPISIYGFKSTIASHTLNTG